MYDNKMVVAIKNNGKVLREFKDTVLVPFGSEYSVLLKNLNTVKALINIFIDGENVVPGGLVLAAGQEIDLERSVKNGNLTEGNRFKFIERTTNIENGPRGAKLEDGIVRIEFEFEVQKPLILKRSMIGPIFASGSSDHSTGDWKDSALLGTTLNVNSVMRSSAVTGQSANTTPVNDVGITVPGSKSEQRFQEAAWFQTDQVKHNIVLKLLGETADNKRVTEPITVKHKPECITCGKKNKATAKFCSECGTSLTIF